MICPFCGSVLQPEDSGALALLQKVARKRQDSVLPLHARGKLDGTTWEIIGVCWRRCVVDGIAYPWQEFLLFNPFKGYRWLLYAMSDGHWSFGHVLHSAPKLLDTRHHTVALRDQSLKHFQGVDALVTYVEGEFTWEVQVGDNAHIDDFIAPPLGVSIEHSSGPDGVELTHTLQRHISPAEVWAAFGQQGAPPSTHGVGPLQPNPWRGQLPSLWLSCAALFLVWALALSYVAGQATEKTIFSREDISFAASLAEELTIGTPGSDTTLEVSFSAFPLSNSWAFAEVMLVNLATEEAIGLGLEAEYYTGIEGGESWSEGDLHPSQVLSLPGGRYLLQVTPQRDTAALGPGFNPFAPTGPTSYDLLLREDLFLSRYAVLPLLIIFLFPLIAHLLSARIERKRWENSDYGE